MTAMDDNDNNNTNIIVTNITHSNISDHNSSCGGGNVSEDCGNDTGLRFDRWGLNEQGEEFAVPAVFAIIFVIGLVGNGTLIYTVAMNKVSVLSLTLLCL
jgi:hypothetical protein